MPENPVLIESGFCHFTGNRFSPLETNPIPAILGCRPSAIDAGIPVPFEARGIDSDEPSRFSYGSKTATDCVLPANSSFFIFNPIINTLRGFWDDCGKFTPLKHSSVSFYRGKHPITAWHKTCVHLWQYAMAMDVAAAKLRS